MKFVSVKNRVIMLLWFCYREGGGESSPKRKGLSHAGKKRKRTAAGRSREPTGSKFYITLSHCDV